MPIQRQPLLMDTNPTDEDKLQPHGLHLASRSKRRLPKPSLRLEHRPRLARYPRFPRACHAWPKRRLSSVEDKRRRVLHSRTNIIRAQGHILRKSILETSHAAGIAEGCFVQRRALHFRNIRANVLLRVGPHPHNPVVFEARDGEVERIGDVTS